MGNLVNCLIDDRDCEKPGSIIALENQEPMKVSDAFVNLTVEGVSDRLGWIESHIYKLTLDNTYQDILIDLINTFPSSVDLPFFQILKAFASQIPSADQANIMGAGLSKFDDADDFDLLFKFTEAYEDQDLKTVDFSVLRDLSDNTSKFLKFLSTLPGDNKFDTFFEDYLNDESLEIDVINELKEEIHEMAECLRDIHKILKIHSLAITALAEFSTTSVADISDVRYDLETNYVKKHDHHKDHDSSKAFEQLIDANISVYDAVKTMDDLSQHTYVGVEDMYFA